jgi:hypothetical protein
LIDNIAGGAAYVSGIVGQAVAIPDTLAGSNRLTATTSPDLNLGADWTNEAFVYRDANNPTNAEWERVWTKWGEGGNEWHTAFRGNSGAPIPDGLDLFANGAQVLNHNTTSMSAPTEQWFRLAYVGSQAANTITAWINGVEVGMAPTVTTSMTTTAAMCATSSMSRTPAQFPSSPCA